jgi:NAD(P)H dehydrogenase (quinone)
MIEVLVLYYSSGGNVRALARYIANGINSVAGAKARVRTVKEVSAGHDNNNQSIVKNNTNEYATPNDLFECKGLAVGSPVRFGNMASHLKYFWDSTSSEWLLGGLSGKPACVFTSSGSIHGGQETCLLSMMLPLIHHGMLIVGIPYTQTELMTTTTGGTPYGASHVAGMNDDLPLSEDERQLAFAMGKRLAEVTLKLQG